MKKMNEYNSSEYITPNYETITTSQKSKIYELINSSLLNGFNVDDYYDILKIFENVIKRLECNNENNER